MTILLYQRHELQERTQTHLNVWKAWHIILFVCAAIFGIMNYVFLQNTIALVNENCVLYPRKLAFRAAELPEAQYVQDLNVITEFNITTDDAQLDDNAEEEIEEKVKRETNNNETTITSDRDNDRERELTEDNVTTITGNKTHRLVLDTWRTLFEDNADCVFAEYMPLLSTMFAIVWLTMFTMCPSGGRVRTGLTQPWRILPPALLFTIVMVGLTGHSFTLTNGGLGAFCEGFYNVTNSTTCSAVDPHIQSSWNASWAMSGRITATRACSAAVWASWACACALLLARCLAAPDFQVKRTAVLVTQDPQQKIIPYLKKSKKSVRSSQSSPNKEDNLSIRSDPTATTELVSGVVEPEDSAPTSLLVTPVKISSPRNRENIEMTYTSQELNDTPK